MLKEVGHEAKATSGGDGTTVIAPSSDLQTPNLSANETTQAASGNGVSCFAAMESQTNQAQYARAQSDAQQSATSKS